MPRKGKHGKAKYEEDLLKCVNSFFRRDRDALTQFVSCTKIELSGDYSYAKLYWDTFDPHSKEKFSQAIPVIRPRLRNHLAQNLSVRQIPQLRFLYDGQFESEKNIERLLREERGS